MTDKIDNNDGKIKELQDKIDKVEKAYDKIVDDFFDGDDPSEFYRDLNYRNLKLRYIRLKCFDRILKKLKSDLKVLTDRKVGLSINEMISKAEELNKENIRNLIAKHINDGINAQLDEFKVFLKCKWTKVSGCSYDTSCGWNKIYTRTELPDICGHCKRGVIV